MTVEERMDGWMDACMYIRGVCDDSMSCVCLTCFHVDVIQDDGNGAPTASGTTRMTPLTPKSVKRTPVQRLIPNTTNPDSPLSFIPENNIIRFNKLMLEDVTLG